MNKTENMFIYVTGIILILKMPFLKSIQNLSVVFQCILIGIGLCYIIKNIRVKKLSKTYLYFLLSVFIIDLYSIIADIVSNTNYKDSWSLYSLNLSFGLYTIGYFYNKSNKYMLEKLFKIIIICTNIVAINIFYENFGGLSYKEINQYVVLSKNAIGSMLVICIMITMYMIQVTRSKNKIIMYTSIIFQLYVLTILQNRSGILALIIPLVYFLIRKIILMIKDGKLIKLLIYSIFIVSSFMIKYDSISEYIKWSLRLESINNGGITNITSGRDIYFTNAISILKMNKLLGVGEFYVDNLYLCILVQFGLLIGTIYIGTYIQLILFSIRGILYRNDEIDKLLGMFIIATFIISFLEGLAPYGPGTSYMMVWFVYGYINNTKLGERNYGRKKNVYKYWYSYI